MYAEVFLREVTPDSALGLVGVLPSDTLSDLAERVGGLLEPPPPEELSLYVARWPPLPGGTPLFPLLPAMSAGKGKGKGGDGAARADDDGSAATAGTATGRSCRHNG